MAKNFYSQDEACQKLEMTAEQLKDLVRNGSLREFRDGGKITYKITEVDQLAAEAAIDDNVGAASLGGSLSALDMLGTAELTLDDTASSTGGADMDLRLADDDDKPARKASPPKLSPPPDLGASDSLMLAEDDALGGSTKGGSGTGELILEPLEEDGGDSGIRLGTGADAVSLDDTTAEESGENDKEGTVVTSIGVSVFDDDEDVEAAADPLAQTVVSDGSEALGVDAVGSGSGLLDLTRESDDTSLGAELLDEIYPGDEGAEMGEATRAGLANEIPEGASAASSAALPVEAEVETIAAAGGAGVAVMARTRLEFAPDAFSTGLTGMMFVAVLVMCLAGLTIAAALQGTWPAILGTLAAKMPIVGGAALGAALVALGVGFMVGKRRG